MVRRNRAEKRLTFTTDLAQRGPRTRRSSSSPSARPPARTARRISSTCSPWRATSAKAMNGYKVIVNKSTVPVGTAAKVRDDLRRETTHPFSVVSNPEFLKQGAAIDDFMKPDRVVIGAEDARAAELMTRALRPVHADRRADHDDGLRQRRAVQVRGERDAGDAHLVHERGGERVRSGRGRRRPGAPRGRRRTGASARRFCFPASATAAAAFPRTSRRCCGSPRDSDYEFQILRVGRDRQRAPEAAAPGKMKQHFGSLKGKRIAVWGLAFKPKTDDMREAPAVPLINGAAGAGADGARLRSRGDEGGARHLRLADQPTPTNSYDALTGADALVHRHRVERVPRAGLRPHAEADADAGRFSTAGTSTIREQIRAHGFTYFSMGRP